jgi:hypothetical protein
MKSQYTDTNMKVVIATILFFIVIPLVLWFFGSEYLEEIDQKQE